MTASIKIVCIHCKQAKPLCCFHNDVHRKLGKKTRCADCTQKRQQALRMRLRT